MEGERQLQAGNYGEAEKHFARAVAEAEQRRYPAPQHIELGLGLAEAQRKQGKLAEAAQTLCAVLEHSAREKNLSCHVLCLDALADVFHQADNFPEAEKMLQEAARIEAALPHPEPARMARRMYKLGIERHRGGGDAIPPLEEAVALHERAFGKDHLDTGNRLTELGVIYRAQGNHEKAQCCLRRALSIHEKCCGPDSQEVLQDVQHLAGSLEESGDVKAAAAQWEHGLTLKEQAVGGDLEELAEMQSRVAQLHIGWGNYIRARELLGEAIGMFKRTRGPRLAIAFETLARVEERLGHFQSAVDELAQAAKIWESCGRERSAELVNNMVHRAELLQGLGEKTDAEWLRKQVAGLAAGTCPSRKSCSA